MIDHLYVRFSFSAYDHTTGDLLDESGDDEVCEVLGLDHWPGRVESALAAAPIGVEQILWMFNAPWGDNDPDLVIDAPISALGEGGIGDEIEVETEDGVSWGEIVSIDTDAGLAKIDCNHPFAGVERVDLRLTVMERRAATMFEIARAREGQEIDG